jgi:general L-amino acid transport system permease protein
VGLKAARMKNCLHDNLQANQMGIAVDILSNKRFRAIAFQLLVLLGFVGLLGYITRNAIRNMRELNILPKGNFLTEPGSVDNLGWVALDLMSVDARDPIWMFFVGSAINTIYIAVLGIFFATILGFVIGVMRLSPNWLVSRVAAVYVEIFRNVPLLLWILLINAIVFLPWPSPKEAIPVFDAFVASNRGLYAPRGIPLDGASTVGLVFLAGIIAAIGWSLYARRVQAKSGNQLPVFWVNAALVVALPLAVFFALGQPLSWETPQLKGFNYTGGVKLLPQFLALLTALSLYTASFIAEIVRAGIMSVNKGQREAASSLGLRPGLVMNLVIIPQALRVIIPPLTSQYLNLTKNSSLAIVVGYQEIVAVFMGTILNQSGRAVEIIGMTMAFYLSLSLLISLVMNIYNRAVALKER